MAANLLKHKRSAVPNKSPGTGDLSLGELAINTYDGCIYLKRNRNNNEEVVKICSVPVSDSIITVDSFTGDGVTTAFTLSSAPVSDEYAFVTINGVDQHVDSYSISNTSLTFTEAPDNGDAIEVRVFSLTPDSVNVRDYKTYVYQPSSATATFSGPDVNSNTLTYDIDKVEVYLNGSRLVNGFDYTAGNGTSIVLADNIGSGDTLEVVSLSKATFADHSALKPNTTELTDTAANQIIDTFPVVGYRTAKYLISMSHATEGFHSEEILLMHDDSNVHITTYAQIFSNQSLGTIDAAIVGNEVRLTVTPINSNTTIKLQRLTVAV